MDNILNSSENLKRGALEAKETIKKPEKTTGVLSNVLILSDSVRVRTFKEALIKNHTKGMKTSRSFQRKRAKSVSGRSGKCDAFLAVWIFPVVG